MKVLKTKNYEAACRMAELKSSQGWVVFWKRENTEYFTLLLTKI